jgi:hypothetical protein
MWLYKASLVLSGFILISCAHVAPPILSGRHPASEKLSKAGREVGKDGKKNFLSRLITGKKKEIKNPFIFQSKALSYEFDRASPNVKIKPGLIFTCSDKNQKFKSFSFTYMENKIVLIDFENSDEDSTSYFSVKPYKGGTLIMNGPEYDKSDDVYILRQRKDGSIVMGEDNAQHFKELEEALKSGEEVELLVDDGMICANKL